MNYEDFFPGDIDFEVPAKTIREITQINIHISAFFPEDETFRCDITIERKDGTIEHLNFPVKHHDMINLDEYPTLYESDRISDVTLIRSSDPRAINIMELPRNNIVIGGETYPNDCRIRVYYTEDDDTDCEFD